MIIAAVFAGGMLGTAARYGLSGWVHGRLGSGFPWGTLAVNVTGSFVLGALLPLLELRPPLSPGQAFLVVGCTGAFTTFSSFAYEAVMLLRDSQPLRAATYVAASLTLGLAAMFAAYALVQHFH